MNRFSSVLLVGAGVLFLSPAANAQTSRQGPYYRTDPNRGGYYDGRYPQSDRSGFGRSQNSLVGRVIADLNTAAGNARLDGHEWKHFNEAAQKLREFADRLYQGKFDSGKLDKAIQNLEHLADADRVHPRDRNMLARDIEDLRQLRSTRGRYSNNGYRDYRDDPNWR